MARHTSAMTNGSSSNASTLSSGQGEPYSSNGDVFSENGVSGPCGSEENTLQPLCTISEQKEAEEDYETHLIEKLRNSSNTGGTHGTITEIVQKKPSEESQRNGLHSQGKMKVDYEAKVAFKNEPDKIKRDYDKSRENEHEMAMMSKQFVEDKNAVYSVYRKRPVPPPLDEGENSASTALNNDRNQLKRNNISRQ